MRFRRDGLLEPTHEPVHRRFEIHRRTGTFHVQRCASWRLTGWRPLLLRQSAGIERRPSPPGWYGCACCPSQISRFLPSIGNYIYGTSDKALWVNLFIGNTTEVTIDGKKVVMKQETDYPWDGLVKLTVTSEQPLGKELRIRIPGWCKSYTCRSTGTKSTVRPTRDIPSSRNGKPAT